jgi:hypothetical protein
MPQRLMTAAELVLLFIALLIEGVGHWFFGSMNNEDDDRKRERK